MAGEAKASMEAAAQSERPRTVYERMVAIIGELPAIGKGQFNEQQKFHFRGHDDVMVALNPLLAEHGVFMIPDVIDRIDAQRMTSNNKVMWVVNLHVRFTFFGAGGDSFTGSSWGEGTDMGDKATSKAHTMAFKYMIAEAFALATAEAGDPDGVTAEDSVQPLATDEQVEDLRTSLKLEGIDEDKIEANFAKVRNADGKLTLDYVERNLANSIKRITDGAKPKAEPETETTTA